MIYTRTDPAAFIATCHCGWTHSAPKDGAGNFDCQSSDDAVNEHEKLHAEPAKQERTDLFQDLAP